MCMDCVDPTLTIQQTLDCCKLEELDSYDGSLIEGHSSKVHRRGHDTLMLRVEVSWLDLPVIYQGAVKALKHARSIVAEIGTVAGRGTGKEGLVELSESIHCVVCNLSIHLPCWYCIACKGESLPHKLRAPSRPN